MRQDDLQPIQAKDWLLKNWSEYGVVDTKEDFIALINILQAIGESLDSLHNAVFNCYTEFSGIVNVYGWDSDRDLADALLEFCSFFTEEDFIDSILDRREDYDTESEWVEATRREASDEQKDWDDTQIFRTDDGYVRRVWY